MPALPHALRASCGHFNIEETYPFKYLLNAASGSQNRMVSWILGVASQGILSLRGKRTGQQINGHDEFRGCYKVA